MSGIRGVERYLCARNQDIAHQMRKDEGSAKRVDPPTLILEPTPFCRNGGQTGGDSGDYVAWDM